MVAKVLSIFLTLASLAVLANSLTVGRRETGILTVLMGVPLPDNISSPVPVKRYYFRQNGTSTLSRLIGSVEHDHSLVTGSTITIQTGSTLASGMEPTYEVTGHSVVSTPSWYQNYHGKKRETGQQIYSQIVIAMNFADGKHVCGNLETVEEMYYDLRPPYNRNIREQYLQASNGIVHMDRTEIYERNFTQFSIQGSCDVNAIADAAIAEVQALGHNINELNAVGMIIPFMKTCSFAGVAWYSVCSKGQNAQNICWNINQRCAAWVISHEIGHNHYLHHAGTDPHDTGSMFTEYGDWSSIMGNNNDATFSRFNAANMKFKGWLPSQNILHNPPAGEYVLTALDYPSNASSGKIQLITIPTSERVYELSTRTNLGYAEEISYLYTMGVNLHNSGNPPITKHIVTLLQGATYDFRGADRSFTVVSHQNGGGSPSIVRIHDCAGVTCYVWKTDKWGPCLNGYQARSVYCFDLRSNSSTSDERCFGTRPDETIPCGTGNNCTECPPGMICTDIDGCNPSPCYPGVTCTDRKAPLTGADCGPCPPGYIGDGRTCQEDNVPFSVGDIQLLNSRTKQILSILTKRAQSDSVPDIFQFELLDSPSFNMQIRIRPFDSNATLIFIYAGNLPYRTDQGRPPWYMFGRIGNELVGWLPTPGTIYNFLIGAYNHQTTTYTPYSRVNICFRAGEIQNCAYQVLGTRSQEIVTEPRIQLSWVNIENEKKPEVSEKIDDSKVNMSAATKDMLGYIFGSFAGLVVIGLIAFESYNRYRHRNAQREMRLGTENELEAIATNSEN